MGVPPLFVAASVAKKLLYLDEVKNLRGHSRKRKTVELKNGNLR